ncbi:hypothetical protein PU560_01315, partial [Georgenia sp. 10Sc9-8]|nr:hypothetical protein [Georgenia halotolerans]
MHVLGQFYALAADHVSWDCEVTALRLQRLDIARDFAPVARHGDLLERIGRVSPFRATTPLVRTDDCTGTQTLYRRTTRWVTRLYERGHQYEEKAARTGDPRYRELALQERGKLRYEVQLRTAALTDAGLVTLGDLTEEALWQQAAKYFARSEFGATVGDGATWLTGVLLPRLAAEKTKQVDAVIGQLFLEKHGLAPW